jgi:hypothetical protein
MNIQDDTPAPQLPPWRRSPVPEATARIVPLNAPRPIEVEADAAGLPLAVMTPAGWRRVERVQDVWRVDDEWWRTLVSRRYFTLCLEGDALRTVFQDLMTGAWHAQRY